ncbi:MAG: 30S ribosomal protein S13 [Lentisphaeria bacterium]|nr:30S ribosomal protein S13 [Lentisphaeria bacterium]NQZ67528.1 30S ribosomal protein S13 [Lentisphaeria bacterium]
MPRIVGVDIPEKKKLKVSLRYIFGVGPHLALEICKSCKLDPEMRVTELSEADVGRINSVIQTSDFQVEGDLKRQVQADIRRLQAINCYRGLRHSRSLPCRGQRTKTNARTRKGRKQTVGAIRDKSLRKLANK